MHFRISLSLAHYFGLAGETLGNYGYYYVTTIRRLLERFPTFHNAQSDHEKFTSLQNILCKLWVFLQRRKSILMIETILRFHWIISSKPTFQSSKEREPLLHNFIYFVYHIFAILFLFFFTFFSFSYFQIVSYIILLFSCI